MTYWIRIITIIGFLLSAYALYTEKKARASKKYKAICDISDHMSCTKAFTSQYGNVLGLSNSVYGMFFYLVVFLLAAYGNIQYIFYLGIISVIGSAYLAYVLYAKVKTFCLVCTSIYLVNILILILSYRIIS